MPEEYKQADPQFGKLIEEAEKYLGFPYVWGGSSPDTSFDCSGFVSYVFTNSGVYNTGRLGATGLYGICQKITADEARPGDLIFFEGTMGEDVGGITHVGLYVGDNMMIHCGNPIQYAAKERPVSGYMTIYKNVAPYESESIFIYDGGTIINRAVTQIAVRKVWKGMDEGEKRPDIKLTLYCKL